MCFLSRASASLFSKKIESAFRPLLRDHGLRIADSRDLGSGRRFVVARSSEISLKFKDEMGRFHILVAGPTAPATWSDETPDGKKTWHSPTSVCRSLGAEETSKWVDPSDPPETEYVLREPAFELEHLEAQMRFLKDYFR